MRSGVAYLVLTSLSENSTLFPRPYPDRTDMTTFDQLTGEFIYVPDVKVQPDLPVVWQAQNRFENGDSVEIG